MSRASDSPKEDRHEPSPRRVPRHRTTISSIRTINTTRYQVAPCGDGEHHAHPGARRSIFVAASPAAAATGYWRVFLATPPAYNQATTFLPEALEVIGHEYAFWASDGNSRYRQSARVCALRLDASTSSTTVSVSVEVDRARSYDSQRLTFSPAETNQWKCLSVDGTTVGQVKAAACTTGWYQRCNSDQFVGQVNRLEACVPWNRYWPEPSCSPWLR